MSDANPPYGFGISLPEPYDQAIDRVKAALLAEGFGVLTTIDVQATLQQKLGVAMAPYVILGACNPALANRALAADPTIGLLLPCNVVVWAEDGGIRVDIADPEAMLGIVANTQVRDIAREAKQRLQRALAALAVPQSNQVE